MKIRWLIAILFVSVFVTGLLYAGSVYFWTDENGVRHYSNTGLPNGVEAADVRPEEAPSPQEAPETSDISDTDQEPPEANPSEGDVEQAGPDAGVKSGWTTAWPPGPKRSSSASNPKLKKSKGCPLGNPLRKA